MIKKILANTLRARTKKAIKQTILQTFPVFARVTVVANGGERVYSAKAPENLPGMASKLGARIDLERGNFLWALQRMLALDSYDAGEGFFLWAIHGDPQCSVRVKTPPPGTEVVARPSYTVEFNSKEQEDLDQKARINLIADMFAAYQAARGESLERSTFMESLALALSRVYGHFGEFAQAKCFVEDGLKVMPKSINLKAAHFALEVALEGGEVPARLVKFIGEDNGFLSDRFCAQPFQRFDIGPSGTVLVCCGHWLPTSIGNFVEAQDIDSVLNSEVAQGIRRSVVDGSFKYCNHLDCGEMVQDTLPYIKDIKSPTLRQAIDRDDFKVTKLDQVMFALDQTCNLACPSCRTGRITERFSETEAKTKAIEEKLNPMLENLLVLNLNPAGEVFASRTSRRLLELIDPKKSPNLKIDMISNGTLFSEKEWNKYPNIHGLVRSVRVSTDAAAKETFEKLRFLGDFDTFLENVAFLSRLRQEGVFEELKFSFTYQVENFREMKLFVDFVRRYHGDYAIFERLQNLGAFTQEEFEKRAVHLSAHPLHKEFRSVISDPVFASRDVWHDFEWDDAAKMTSKELQERDKRTY